jgi:hypothetical protein
LAGNRSGGLAWSISGRPSAGLPPQPRMRPTKVGPGALLSSSVGLTANLAQRSVGRRWALVGRERAPSGIEQCRSSSGVRDPDSPTLVSSDPCGCLVSRRAASLRPFRGHRGKLVTARRDSPVCRSDVGGAPPAYLRRLITSMPRAAEAGRRPPPYSVPDTLRGEPSPRTPRLLHRRSSPKRCFDGSQ